MDTLEERILVVNDPLRPDRHLRVHDHHDLIKRQTSRLIFRQERDLLRPLGLAAALERVLADRAGTCDHGFGGLAHGLAQLLDGLFVRGRQVELDAGIALQRPPRVFAVDFIDGRDGLGHHREMPAIGAQHLDTLGHDWHLSEPVELVEHDHHRPGLVRPRLLVLKRG